MMVRTINGYRYGFNGMEMDNEVSGNGNSYTTQFRQYDPRLGRWKSLDPLMGKYPWMSPYVAFNNNPIYFIDPFGLEGSGNGDKEEMSDGQKKHLWKRMWNKNVRQAFRDQKSKGGKVSVWKKDGEVYASRSGTQSSEMPTENSDGSIDFGEVYVAAQIYRPMKKDNKKKSFWNTLQKGDNYTTNIDWLGDVRWADARVKEGGKGQKETDLPAVGLMDSDDPWFGGNVPAEYGPIWDGKPDLKFYPKKFSYFSDDTPLNDPWVFDKNNSTSLTLTRFDSIKLYNILTEYRSHSLNQTPDSTEHFFKHDYYSNGEIDSMSSEKYHTSFQK